MNMFQISQSLRILRFDLLAVPTLLVVLSVSLQADQKELLIEFNRDIRPILADACLNCHGADKESRATDLQLDIRESAVAPREEGFAIQPGSPEQSELVKRILSRDESILMPPPEVKRRLTSGEIETLIKWIQQGAPYAKHWAFIRPQRFSVPELNDLWGTNEIDHFIMQRLQGTSLSPKEVADKLTLIRRVTLDLIGLPPTRQEVDQFLVDPSEDAYVHLVDRLLASPHYGEHMAVTWMDLARYADSSGYQGDIPRTMWPWRDWVINAYNQNMPFDQFTVEQLAGDLLPHPTNEQIIATGFNRNHRVNDEDGIIPEEFRVEYVVDRVETTSLAWLGLSLGCARCHDHKFDPLSQKDFYSFMAYFNSVDEYGRGYGNTQPLFYFDPSIRETIESIDQELIDLGDAAQGEYQKLIDLKNKRDEVLAKSLTTMVMRDLPEPRKTHIFKRGQYDHPLEEVSHNVPHEVMPLKANSPPNRLGLAQWLMDPEHPLTARVAVNRIWQMHFGTGLVATPEDFGTRGEAPSHPELLDWLALRFIDSDWDVKALHRLIVTSATYMQSSQTSEQHYLEDPNNRLLARGPRLRLSAEMIRDQALAASGLLDDRIGGPSVKPYQPEGVWSEMVSFFPEYLQDHGRDLYRRSLYTYLRRTVQPPSMNVLDLQSRETCQVKRVTTNTPLQALVLMNDPTYLESARVLAAKSMLEPNLNEADAIWLTEMFQRILVRPPTGDELAILSNQLQFHRKKFTANPERARPLAEVGESVLPASLDLRELSARTAILSLIFNLDETLNRE